MDPITTITGAWESLKVAAGLGKAVMDLKVEGEVREKVIAMQEAVLAAQQRMREVEDSHAGMAEKVRKLEEELAKYQNWEREKQRYALQRTEAGGSVYGFKPGMENGELPHYLCPNCFEDRIKSILQPSDRKIHQTLVCHRCTAEIRLATGGMRIHPGALELAGRKP